MVAVDHAAEQPEHGRVEPRWHRHWQYRVMIARSISGTRPLAPAKRLFDGHTNAGLDVAFHPAGTLLASSGWDNRLRLWDAVLGRPVLSLTEVALLIRRNSARMDESSIRSRSS